jgi:hypothetical protein
MAEQVGGNGWSLSLPDGVTGGPLAHSHTHLLTMARYLGQADDGTDLEVIVTTYPGDPIGERGEPLDRGGEPWIVPGARVATRRDQLTYLEIDPAAPPVETTIVVAISRSGGSVCLVLHRPVGSPATSSEAVLESFVVDGASP